MFPGRVRGAVIRDRRWKLEPDPVDWTIRSALARPLAQRRAPASGISGILMAPTAECFAIAMPEETEGHYSLYLSLRARSRHRWGGAARVRLVVAVAKSDAAVIALHEAAEKEWKRSD
jgi:hypothetical protein